MPFASDSKPFIGINAKNIWLNSRFCTGSHARLPGDGFLEFSQSRERCLPTRYLSFPRRMLNEDRQAGPLWQLDELRCRTGCQSGLLAFPLQSCDSTGWIGQLVDWSVIAAFRDYLARHSFQVR